MDSVSGDGMETKRGDVVRMPKINEMTAIATSIGSHLCNIST